MPMNKAGQLEALRSYCSRLGLEIQYHPDALYFTAIASCPDCIFPPEEDAWALQKQIQRESTQYPGLVCYCFDPFSTLVYAV